MCVNERQDKGSGTVKMKREDLAKVEDFRYLDSSGVQAGWNGWRRMPGVICDRLE